MPYIWYREYLEVKLKCPLIPGEIYCCEMFVSRSENTVHAQNSLAMYFSDTLVYNYDYENLYFTPQVVEWDVIRDTSDWVKISGSFTATSAAQYLIIGVFAFVDDIEFEVVETPADDKIPFSYYYIDDISVERVNAPLVISGNSPICPGESVKLKATGWDNIKWTQVNNPNRILSHNDSLIIKPTSAIHSYRVVGTQCGHKFTEVVTVDFKTIPQFDLGNDTLICAGSSITLDPGPGLSNYLWQDGSGAATYEASLPVKYIVKAYNNDGCFNKDSIALDYYTPPMVSLGGDFEMCLPEGTLDAFTGRSYDHYTWQDGSTAASFQFFREGTYFVTVENPCAAKASDTIHINRISMFLPNLITPNKDGKNENFEIQGIKMQTGTLKVYNRDGLRVYYNEHYNNDWSGEELANGIYYYVLEYPTCEDKKGWLEVVK
jgi:gliding motility-associated-like protein